MCCFSCVQVMNLHSCIQVNADFVSPEHAHNTYYLTQELRPFKDQVNYEDKLQVTAYFHNFYFFLHGNFGKGKTLRCKDVIIHIELVLDDKKRSAQRVIVLPRSLLKPAV